jgi:hypothetical protein
LIFDDSIQEKQWTDETEMMCQGRMVKGINRLNALYHSGDVSMPVAFEIIRKPIQYSEITTRKLKRASTVTKNELIRKMIGQYAQNQLKFRYILFDCWFVAKENFEYILKKNRFNPLSLC